MYRMSKMRNFIKIHWFGILLSFISVLFLGLMALVFYSPRQDVLKRGFIPCTQQLVKDVFACGEHKHWCMSKAIVKNTGCDFKVVLDGAKAWAEGKQPAPWSNYLFEPKLPEPEAAEDDAAIKAYYAENPHSEEDMLKLQQDWDTLEKEWNNAKADSDSEVAVKEEVKQNIHQNIKDVVRENVNEEQK